MSQRSMTSRHDISPVHRFLLWDENTSQAISCCPVSVQLLWVDQENENHTGWDEQIPEQLQRLVNLKRLVFVFDREIPEQHESLQKLFENEKMGRLEEIVLLAQIILQSERYLEKDYRIRKTFLRPNVAAQSSTKRIKLSE